MALNGYVRLVPVFGNVELKMDHSGVSNIEYASGLETMIYSTYRNSYQNLDDPEYYVFNR